MRYTLVICCAVFTSVCRIAIRPDIVLPTDAGPCVHAWSFYRTSVCTGTVVVARRVAITPPPKAGNKIFAAAVMKTPSLGREWLHKVHALKCCFRISNSFFVNGPRSPPPLFHMRYDGCTFFGSNFNRVLSASYGSIIVLIVHFY